MSLILHIVQWLINKLTNFMRAHAAWQCHFCKKFFTTGHPRVNAYHDGEPIFQCEDCRIRLEDEKTPIIDPRLDDSYP
jgi:hypothetical protein